MSYSQAQYQQDEEYLRRQIASIYATPVDGFAPTLDLSVCARCEYQPLCYGGRALDLGAGGNVLVEEAQAEEAAGLWEARLEEADLAEEEGSQGAGEAWDRLPELP